MALAYRLSLPRLPSALLVTGLLAAACNSDLVLVDDSTTSTSSTGPITTEPPPPWDFSTTAVDPTTGEPGDLSCRGAIACLINCALNVPTEPTPEPDLSCFLECEEGMSAEEVYDLFKFMNCVTDLCIETGACDPNDLGGDDCTACFLNNLALDEPPGCEAEGLACMH
ncbi:MAG: hypothetical protein H6711_08130 [Myxococcales bacterium]|nr:hypothetical protein [Myxococcales bacterium]